MADYDVLLPEVLPEVPGVPEPLAIREIRAAVVDFCDRTKVAKITTTGAAIVADDPFVLIPELTGKSIIDVQYVSIDGYDLKKASADYLNQAWRDENLGRALFSDYHSIGYNPSWETWQQYKQDRPEVYHFVIDDTGTRFRFVGIPRRSYTTLAYTIRVKPNRTSTGFDTWLIDAYYKELAAGAISRLLSIPKKDWTDLPTAALYGSRYEEAVTCATGEGIRDFTRDDETTLRTTAYV
jgi:hypothetical protein